MTRCICIDTSVLVEFIDESGDFHSQAKLVIDNVVNNKLTGLVAHPVFAELYYISYRLYEKSYQESANNNALTHAKAKNLLNWLFKSPNILMAENTNELALEVGKIKQKFSLALPDSYVIALAKLNHCEALFKGVEEEMKGNKLGRLKKEEGVKLVFLEDFASTSSA